MSHVAHELHEEFPEQAEAIRAPRSGDAHCAKIAGLRHEINRAIRRVGANVEPVADEALEEMKKRRLSLKDETSQFLATA